MPAIDRLLETANGRRVVAIGGLGVLSGRRGARPCGHGLHPPRRRGFPRQHHDVGAPTASADEGSQHGQNDTDPSHIARGIDHDARNRRDQPDRGERSADRRHQRPGNRGGGQRPEFALHSARGRKVGGDRAAARHQGRADRRPQDRQRGHPLGSACLHHRGGRGPDQHLLLRRRRPPDRRFRHRGQARSQRHPQRRQAGAAGIRNSGGSHRGRRSPDRQRRQPRRGANGLRDRDAAARRRDQSVHHQRRQDRECHHGPRPRPGDDQDHGRRDGAHRDQAARHRSQRQLPAPGRRRSISATRIP